MRRQIEVAKQAVKVIDQEVDDELAQEIEHETVKVLNKVDQDDGQTDKHSNATPPDAK